MNIQDKPDYKVFASEARGGEVTDFPNLERGWGETIDKTEKIPPMEWFNLVGKRADEWLLYLTQRGVAEWDAKVKYPQYAMCQLSGKFYIAINENENRNPENSQSLWVDLAKYLGVDGKLDESKVVQTTGQSQTSVMSQKSSTDNFQGKGFSFSKNESDNRYERKQKTFRRIDNINGFIETGSVIELKENILGKYLYVKWERTSDFAMSIIPVDNTLINFSNRSTVFAVLYTTNNGTKLHVERNANDRITQIYLFN